MSSFDKVIKAACKPKPDPPKSKYLDSIIAATWSEDGAVHDVCKALSPRFKEPNAVVVFKALIVLHTMIRNGATDNVLGYLSTTDVLKLRNVSAGNWEGYSAPENLQNYATYLDSRIRAYRDLKHDAIRVQSETNRDMRNSNAIDNEADINPRRGANTLNQPERRKTIMGRKLRIMTVEKGLLRETKVVQKMINALVECRFYLDNLDDQLNIATLRMLVKDLLILFQACNEGVINVLEHYFEMSRVDAGQALSLYRHFCKQTERVVEYLGVAKKLQNILNVPIPNLKHAPVSLAGALEEYLNDPNFEQNRIEYKTNKEASERPSRTGNKARTDVKKDKVPDMPISATASSSSSAPPAAATNGKDVHDFFTAIEEEQPTLFNPQTNSPTGNYFQQQAAFNPFSQGGAFSPQPMQMQQTGFVMPQNTAFQAPPQPFSGHNPFGQMQHSQQNQPPMSFMQPQPNGFMAPQMTGANPFRQNSLGPQPTGFSPFAQPTGNTNPFPFVQEPQQQQQQQQPQQSSNLPSFNFTPFGSSQSGSFNAFSSPTSTEPPPRPSSAPLSSLIPSTSPFTAPSPPAPAEPVKTHVTGSRNPFGIPTAPAPSVPKVPTLMELAMGYQNNNSPQQQQPQQTGAPGQNGFSASTQPSAMSNVASDFSFLKSGENVPSSSFTKLAPQSTSGTNTSYSSTLFSSLSSQPTGATTNTTMSSAFAPSNTATSPPPVVSHVTGVFTGLKAFKPSSSFGAQLLDSLPPIPQSAPGTPAEQPSPGSTGFNVGQSNGAGSQPNGFSAPNGQQTGGFGANSFGNNNTFGGGGGGSPFGTNGASSVGAGLRPQITGGAGGANPFRASAFGSVPPSTGAQPPLPNNPMFSNFTGAPGGAFFPNSGGAFGQNQSPQQQTQQQQLI